MKLRGDDAEDELFDLNKEPVESKRKRAESDKKGSDRVPEVAGRVLRSRTMAVSDGEKQVIESVIVKVDDKEDACEVSVSESRKIGCRLGRNPKGEGNCRASSSSFLKTGDKSASIKGKIVNMEEDEDEESVSPKRKKMKGRLGRPPKREGKHGVSSSSFEKTGDETESDGEEQVIKEEVVKTDDDDDETVIPILPKWEKMKGRRGRPRKTEQKKDDKGFTDGELEDKVEIEVLLSRKRENMTRRLGRPPNKDNVVLQQIKRRGRPPKVENRNLGNEVEKKMVKGRSDGDGKKAGNEVSVKRLKVGDDFENGNMRHEKAMVKSAESKEMGPKEQMGPREQKQLLRDQIVSMLYKAGWTVEYRQRQSKAYQDAIYVDLKGRGYWSVTLAYKKLKEIIDKGEASDAEVSAFSPIPDETFSLLFRVTEKGKKAGKKKINPGMTIKRVPKKVESVKISIQSREDHGKKRTLLARKPKEGSGNNGCELYEGNRSLLSWMIDLGTVTLDGKVKYKKGRTKRNIFEGRITKDGICCDCCSITYTIWDFESHAQSDLGKPLANIYLDSGDSLLQCLVDSWKKHVEVDNIGFVNVDVDGDDPNDDTCNICGDGGNLICCDSCPSTFHHGCLHIKIPSGDWHCVYCSCKFCGESYLTTDDDEELSSDFCICRLCEEKFHVNCIKDDVAEDDNENPSFCGNDCLKTLEQLQALIGVRHEIGEGFFYTILQYQDLSSDASLDGDSAKVENNSKLAIAFSVMDECFQPIIDERSGTNMIHNVVYNCGSNIRRLNYSGFYTIILEKGDELVAAASLRIHGRQLAEMPFIGTRFLYRRQGVCSRLLTAIEKALSSLGIEKLVIPAISQLNETWTKVFGFSPLEESERQEMKHMSVIAFPGVDMLQKPILVNQLKKVQTGSTAMECTEDEEENHSMQEKPASVSDTSSSDAQKANLVEPVIKSFEVEEQNSDAAGLAAPKCDSVDSAEDGTEHHSLQGKPVSVSDTSSDERKANLIEPAIESTQVKHNQITQELENKIVAGLAAPKSDSADSEVDNPNHDKVDSEIFPNGTPKNENTSDDSKLKLPDSFDELNGCLNGLLSVNGNGKIMNCDDCEVSGVVEGEEQEEEVKKQGCCVS